MFFKQIVSSCPVCIPGVFLSVDVSAASSEDWHQAVARRSFGSTCMNESLSVERMKVSVATLEDDRPTRYQTDGSIQPTARLTHLRSFQEVLSNNHLKSIPIVSSVFIV